MAAARLLEEGGQLVGHGIVRRVALQAAREVVDAPSELGVHLGGEGQVEQGAVGERPVGGGLLLVVVERRGLVGRGRGRLGARRLAGHERADLAVRSQELGVARAKAEGGRHVALGRERIVEARAFHVGGLAEEGGDRLRPRVVGSGRQRRRQLPQPRER